MQDKLYKEYSKWFENHFGYPPDAECYRMIDLIKEMVAIRDRDLNELSKERKRYLKIITFQEYKQWKKKQKK